MTTTQLTPLTDETLSDMVMSLTGFDEIAIAKFFDGLDPYTDAETKPIPLNRALVFVHLRRQGKTDQAAHAEAMGWSMNRITTYFAEESADEAAAEELGLPPVTPAGEDVPSVA